MTKHPSILAQFMNGGEIPENSVSNEDLDFQDVAALTGQINRLRSFRNQMTRMLYTLLEKNEAINAQLATLKRGIMAGTTGGLQAKNTAVTESEEYTDLLTQSKELSVAISIVQNEISTANGDIQLCRTGMYNREIRGGGI